MKSEGRVILFFAVFGGLIDIAVCAAVIWYFASQDEVAMAVLIGGPAFAFVYWILLLTSSGYEFCKQLAVQKLGGISLFQSLIEDHLSPVAIDRAFIVGIDDLNQYLNSLALYQIEGPYADHLADGRQIGRAIIVGKLAGTASSLGFARKMAFERALAAATEKLLQSHESRSFYAFINGRE